MLPTRLAWVVAVVSIVSRSILSTVVALLLWSLLPNFVGFQTSVVMSGSMAPRLEVGDAVVVRPVDPSQLVPGRILLFDDPDTHGRLRMHRLVEMRPDGRLVTKGDANATVDSSAVAIDAVHGAGFLRVPFAGLPTYWYRTGQVVPFVLTGMAIMMLIAGVRSGRLLEGPDEQQRRRHRGSRLPALHRATAAGVLVAALSASALAAPQSARAVYSSTIQPSGSVWSSPCGEISPSAVGTAPRFYWSYGVGSGTAVADQGGNADPGLLAGDYSRTGCSAGRSPFVSVGVSSPGGVIETRSSQLPGDMTIATWFKTTSKSGVLADFGNSNTSAASASIDRVVYMRADGNVTFATKTQSLVGGLLTANVMYCTTTNPQANAYADGSWHLFVATFGNSVGCTLTLDNGVGTGSAVAQTPTLTLLLLSGYMGYWRFGYDAVTPTNWAGATAQPSFVGSLDESQAYDAILDPTARGRIWTRSH